MNKQVYADYTSYIKYSGQVPTYCNVYREDVFQERLELPARLFHVGASDEMTEEGLAEFFRCNVDADLDLLRVTFHEDLEIVHIVEEADRLTNGEAFWENCGWRFGDLTEHLDDATKAKIQEVMTSGVL